MSWESSAECAEIQKALKKVSSRPPPVQQNHVQAVVELAMNKAKFYKGIVFELERFLRKGRLEYKVPGLYLINAVCAASKKKFLDKDNYVPRFIQKGFPALKTLRDCSLQDKSTAIKVLKHWASGRLFPEEFVQSVAGAIGVHLVPGDTSQMQPPPRPTMLPLPNRGLSPHREAVQEPQARDPRGAERGPLGAALGPHVNSSPARDPRGAVLTALPPGISTQLAEGRLAMESPGAPVLPSALIHRHGMPPGPAQHAEDPTLMSREIHSASITSAHQWVQHEPQSGTMVANHHWGQQEPQSSKLQSNQQWGHATQHSVGAGSEDVDEEFDYGDDDDDTMERRVQGLANPKLLTDLRGSPPSPHDLRPPQQQQPPQPPLQLQQPHQPHQQPPQPLGQWHMQPDLKQWQKQQALPSQQPSQVGMPPGFFGGLRGASPAGTVVSVSVGPSRGFDGGPPGISPRPQPPPGISSLASAQPDVPTIPGITPVQQHLHHYQADGAKQHALTSKEFVKQRKMNPGDEFVEIMVPNRAVGLIIGKGGGTIKSLQQGSGAFVQTQRDTEAAPGAMDREVYITGTSAQIETCKEMIEDVLKQDQSNQSQGGKGKGKEGSRWAGLPQRRIPAERSVAPMAMAFNPTMMELKPVATMELTGAVQLMAVPTPTTNGGHGAKRQRT